LGPGLLDGLHGRRLAPYHPGPGAHEFQGQMLAHAHLGLLAEAADLALREAHAIGSKRGALKSDSQGQDTAAAVARRLESWWAAPGLEAPEPNKPPGTASASAPPTWELPPPVGCHRAFCESGHFQCFTTYTPRHTDFDLAKRVLPTAAAAAAASSQGRAHPKAALPRWGPRPQGHPKGTWAIASPPNTNADHHKSFGYLDFKFSLRGDKDSGELLLGFTSTLEGSPVVCCQPQCPWGKCKGDQVLLEDPAAVAWALDGKGVRPFKGGKKGGGLHPHEAALAKAGTCVVVARAAEPGEHVLGVKVLQGAAFLSHLLVY